MPLAQIKAMPSQVERGRASPKQPHAVEAGKNQPAVLQVGHPPACRVWWARGCRPSVMHDRPPAANRPRGSSHSACQPRPGRPAREHRGRTAHQGETVAARRRCAFPVRPGVPAPPPANDQRRRHACAQAYQTGQWGMALQAGAQQQHHAAKAHQHAADQRQWHAGAWPAGAPAPQRRPTRKADIHRLLM